MTGQQQKAPKDSGRRAHRMQAPFMLFVMGVAFAMLSLLALIVVFVGRLFGLLAVLGFPILAFVMVRGVLTFMMPVVIRPHLQASGGDERHDARDHHPQHGSRPMTLPPQHERRQAEHDRNQGQKQLGFVGQERAQAQRDEGRGGERAEGTVDCAKAASDRAEAVREWSGDLFGIARFHITLQGCNAVAAATHRRLDNTRPRGVATQRRNAEHAVLWLML